MNEEVVTQAVEEAVGGDESTGGRLLFRWFVQYNPMYFASALLVLVGIFLVSKGINQVDDRPSEMVLAAITQLYELLLIGGAALLYRVAGQRRPAVILALLEVLYICDITLQTEVSAFPGVTGLVPSTIWLAMFALKLRALAWALNLRLSRSAFALPLLGALGVAVVPHLLQHRVLSEGAATTLLAWYAFGLVAAAYALEPSIESRDELDDWGTTVLGRATKATWMVWASFMLVHLLCWSHAHELSIAPFLITGGLLVTTLRARSEPWLWAGTATALVAAGWIEPASLSATALMATVVLGIKGWRGMGLPASRHSDASMANHPYRTSALDPEELEQLPDGSTPLTMRRPYVGAMVCLYLSIWTLGWQGSAFQLPDHLLWLDLLAMTMLGAVVWRWRMTSALISALAIAAHFGVERQVVTEPRGALQWGMLLLAAGFALLLGGLALNWKHRGGFDADEGGGVMLRAQQDAAHPE
jgi:hypothetical protein